LGITLGIPDGRRGRSKFVWIASLTASAALLALPALFPLDGRRHSDWQQFLGRFHPAVVHLPIGLILLIPLLEVAGGARPALREAADFVLSLSVFACLGALALGYLLAYGSGDIGAAVVRHMWSGIALTIATLACALLRPAWAAAKTQSFFGGIYPSALAASIALLAWTAHQGGSLTHGDHYLTEYLPAPLKHWNGFWMGRAATVVPPDSFYAQHIDPVFKANCVACHGEAEVKGGLRLDSYDGLMSGGKEGAVVVSGQPERSILLGRLTLPRDDRRAMPGDGKPPLKPEEIAMIRAWIAQGASPTATSLGGVASPAMRTPAAGQPAGSR
jgi:mono/diheme cytochrome c family protein